MLPAHRGQHWHWLQTPEGQLAHDILLLWIDDLTAGKPVVSLLHLLRALQAAGFQMNDQSNLRRWLTRSYGYQLIDQAVRGKK